MTKKLNMAELANKIRKQFKGDENKASTISIGSEMTTPSAAEDFIVLNPWWKQATGLLGLPYGYVFMIAGNTDSGKTSFTIECMKAAQEQGVHIILVDTEKKTTKQRLLNWGVDPEGIARVQPSYLEEAYDGIEKWWNAIKDADPDGRILIVFDSLGNTPANAEVETDVDDSLQMGLAAKVNKRGFRRMVPRLAKDKVHILVINQTYANMGSPGRTNAGGNAVDYFSGLTFQTSRKKWIEKKDKKSGEDIRVGAQVQWTLYKNHLIDASSEFQKKLVIDITSKGMRLVGAAETEEGEE